MTEQPKMMHSGGGNTEEVEAVCGILTTLWWEMPDFLDVSIGIGESNGLPLCPTCQRETTAMYLDGRLRPVS